MCRGRGGGGGGEAKGSATAANIPADPKKPLFCAQELDRTIKTINYAVNSLEMMMARL